MAQLTAPNNASSGQATGLLRFINLLLGVGGFNLCFRLVQTATSPAQVDLLALGQLVVLQAIFVVARVWLTRGLVQRAALLLSGSLLGAAVFTKLAISDETATNPTLVLFPVLAVALALPYIDRRALRQLIVFAAIISAAIAAIDNPNLLAGFGIVGVLIQTAASSLVLFLLWLFSARMHEMLEQTRLINTDLQVAKDHLETQIAERQRLQQREIDLRHDLEQAVETYLAFVQRVAAGDLGQHLTVQHGGALGQLGQGLNRMVEQLHQTSLTEQQAQAKARRLQQSETHNRQRLEHTVEVYLAFVSQVAQGDLTRRLAVDDEGAIGQLGHGLNRMTENLQRMTLQIRQATDAISTVTAQIVAATAQQAAAVVEQSSAISQASTTIEEINMIALQTAQQASQVAQESQAMLQVARQGSQAVEETVGSMRQIASRVQETAQTILTLSEQTQTINTIITMVRDLADQSNLLALNAAIEAARAGAQGKGFAVVAQHVRALAERSKDATSRVRAILEDIRRSSDAAVTVTEEGSRGAESGRDLALQAGRVIHQIAAEVERGAQANTQMAAAAQQQTVGMQQIAQVIHVIQQAASQAHDASRQTERATHDLHTLSQALQQSIAAYRL